MRHWADAGVTLPEVLVAMLLVGVALVPLLQLYPVTIGADRASEVTTILSAAAVRKMEENISILRAGAANPNGSAACADVPDCRLVWTTTDELSSAAPGVGALKALQVVACQDANASTTCDGGETQVRYDAKVTTRP